MQNTSGQAKKTIIYIPARGNSSRLPGKALADLCGHPLISYTIRIAKALKGIDHVFVDTDSPEIKAVAEEYGAEVPFLRDPALARDKSLLHETTSAFLARVREIVGPIGIQITLMPTSPFRNLQTTQSLYDDLQHHLSVKTVLAADVDTSGSFLACEDGRHPFETLLTNPVSQYDWIKGIGYFHGSYSSNSYPAELLLYNNFKYHVLKNPVELIDIDLQADLDTARRIVSDNLYDFGMAM